MKWILPVAIVVFACSTAFPQDPSPQSPAEQLLKLAAEELNEYADPDDYVLPCRVSQALARFDRKAARQLLLKSFEVARATEDATRSVSRLEAVALYAAPLDEEVSLKALELIRTRVPQGASEEPYIKLKLLAIDMVIADARGRGEEVESLLKEARRFCDQRKGIRKSCVEEDSSVAFAEYVAMLRPQLGAGLWPQTDRAYPWRRRFAIAMDLVHYGSGDAPQEMRALARTAPDKDHTTAAAVALYRAGEIEEAIRLLEEIKPTLIGGGQPLGDLLEKVAASDPTEAVRLARTAGSEVALRAALDMVVRGAAETHPEAVLDVLKLMGNQYRSQHALSQAAISFAQRGDMESAGASVSNCYCAGAKREMSACRGHLTRINSARKAKKIAPAVKMSRNVSFLPTRPACIAGVLTSRPNRSAMCGRTKL